MVESRYFSRKNQNAGDFHNFVACGGRQTVLPICGRSEHCLLTYSIDVNQHCGCYWVENAIQEWDKMDHKSSFLGHVSLFNILKIFLD